jgi:hypothetical protein
MYGHWRTCDWQHKETAHMSWLFIYKTKWFLVSSCYSIFSVMRNVCRSFFFSFALFLLAIVLSFFDLRNLITPLISSNYSLAFLEYFVLYINSQDMCAVSLCCQSHVLQCPYRFNWGAPEWWAVPVQPVALDMSIFIQPPMTRISFLILEFIEQITRRP